MNPTMGFEQRKNIENYSSKRGIKSDELNDFSALKLSIFNIYLQAIKHTFNN